MIINHNLAANNAIRQMNTNSTNASKAMQKLSSGLRINSASDDAAGLAISEKMRGQIRGLDQASSNAQDGISLVQTAEGALNETTSILQRMRELSTQASNDTNTADDRGAIQKEVSQLNSEIDRIANTTEFNTKKLLTGNLGVSTNDGQNITKAAMTTDTQAGTLNLSANGTLATVASATLATAAGKTTVATSDSLTVVANGKTFNVATSAGQTYDDLATQMSSITGLDVSFKSGTGFTFATKDANADQSVSIKETTANALDGATDFTTATTGAGTNATGLAGTGSDGAAASFSYQGNQVTVTSGSQKGLTFTLAADQGSTTTATVSGKSITASGQLQLHIGANQGQTMSVSINAMDSKNLGVSGVDVTTQNGAENAITSVDNAIQTVSAERAKLGAYSNRLEHTINNLGTSSENLTSAESRIRDVDMAKEMSTFSKNNILSQAAQAMLAQANQQPQQVLQLLR
ncbi:flagellin [Clostridium folliculivorans]|uniref:Flagellin n=1 Tax=Clostridium folliculivorans TaxID=2886038 RepID=A0A9W5XZ21_9CLOT|nr:flagellin [Clostridium folliculivorans]GKU23562.1 flagellin [Clostridium folliculivorans]GKU29678.1 flagellin [Clostridium folliculivorans]